MKLLVLRFIRKALIDFHVLFKVIVLKCYSLRVELMPLVSLRFFIRFHDELTVIFRVVASILLEIL